jgi:hypothetical protein
MKSTRLTCTLLILASLASVLQAAPKDNPPARETKPPAKESCQPSCRAMRVSTRCECSLGKTLPAVVST